MKYIHPSQHIRSIFHTFLQIVRSISAASPYIPSNGGYHHDQGHVVHDTRLIRNHNCHVDPPWMWFVQALLPTGEVRWNVLDVLAFVLIWRVIPCCAGLVRCCPVLFIWSNANLFFVIGTVRFSFLCDCRDSLSFWQHVPSSLFVFNVLLLGDSKLALSFTCSSAPPSIVWRDSLSFWQHALSFLFKNVFGDFKLAFFSCSYLVFCSFFHCWLIPS